MYIVFLHWNPLLQNDEFACWSVTKIPVQWELQYRALKYCCLILCSVLGLKFDCTVDAIIKHLLLGLRTPFGYYRISSCRLMISMLCTRYKLIWQNIWSVNETGQLQVLMFFFHRFLVMIIRFNKWENSKMPQTLLKQNMSSKLQTFQTVACLTQPYNIQWTTFSCKLSHNTIEDQLSGKYCYLCLKLWQLVVQSACQSGFLSLQLASVINNTFNSSAMIKIWWIKSCKIYWTLINWKYFLGIWHREGKVRLKSWSKT